MLGVVVHETKGLDIEKPDALVLDSSLILWSLMLGQRSCAIIFLSVHFFLDLCFLSFKKGALGRTCPLRLQ
jgi:hypothetical protein